MTKQFSTFYSAPAAIEAVQWFKNGDHPQDECDGKDEIEGKLVRYFRNPQLDGQAKCSRCGHTWHEHGWIDRGSNGITVCPGSFVTKTDHNGNVAVLPKEALNTAFVSEDNVGSLTDGYHSFNELYEHRHALMCSLMSLAEACPIEGISTFKTRKNDAKESMDGWFIAGINLRFIESQNEDGSYNTKPAQITYHMPDRLWDMLVNTPEIEYNADYDGHSSNDVFQRLFMLTHVLQQLTTSMGEGKTNV